MIKKQTCRLLLLLAASLLAACQTMSRATSVSNGILLWHSWPETEAATLNDIINRFTELYPDLRVVIQTVPAGELRQQYEQTARLGLGPDLFIGPDEWIAPLADQGLLRDLRPLAPRTTDYLSGAVGTMTYANGLYGLPLSLRPMAMYYNTALVDTPATTLDEWLAQAANGRSVALNTNFLASYWGIQAFGGRVFDETGRVVLDEGGYANWLRWLKNAQSAPGMILSRDGARLQELFFSGKAAYYVASPDELAAAREALGENNVLVSALPSGPVGPSGPLLNVEAIFFNPASSAQQTAAALLLAEFLTNANQSTTLLREVSRVPANRTVPVDSRLYPAEAGFATQSRTAVPVPSDPLFDMVAIRSNDLNRAVLEGVADATEVTAAMVNEINTANGFVIEAEPEQVCQQEGVLSIWHPWTGRLATNLEALAAEYMALCPAVTVRLTQISESLLYDLYTGSRGNQGEYSLPAMVFGPSAWVWPFANAQTIQPMTSLLSPEMRQRFRPEALQTVDINSELFGLPYWMDLNALYYNNSQIGDPPVTLNELMQRANENKGVALPVRFVEAYWGAAAQGSRLFTAEFRLALADSGFVDWLTWLTAVQDDPDFLLDENLNRLQTAFYEGETAMLVAPASSLAELEREIGDVLGVAQLPAGQGGEARPWLHTAVIFLTADLSTERRDLALSFTEFATNLANQTTLMQESRLIPVNISVRTENQPAISSFLRGINNAFVPPNVSQIMPVLADGDQVYRDVLSGEKAPLTATCDFVVRVDSANGFAVEPANLPEPCQEQATAPASR